jgi:hypothetical protein
MNVNLTLNEVTLLNFAQRSFLIYLYKDKATKLGQNGHPRTILEEKKAVEMGNDS